MNADRPFEMVRNSIGDGLRFSTCRTTDFAASALEMTSRGGPPPIVPQATHSTAAANATSVRALDMMPPFLVQALARCELFAQTTKARSVPAVVARSSLHMLEVGQTIKLVEVGKAVRATLREPSALEEPPILGS